MSEVFVFEEAGRVAENKYVARAIRENFLAPAVVSQQEVVLDFAGVEIATQSFIHALVSRLIRDTEGAAIELITFRNCNDNVRAVVETVTEYSQDPVEMDVDMDESC